MKLIWNVYWQLRYTERIENCNEWMQLVAVFQNPNICRLLSQWNKRHIGFWLLRKCAAEYRVLNTEHWVMAYVFKVFSNDFFLDFFSTRITIPDPDQQPNSHSNIRHNMCRRIPRNSPRIVEPCRIVVYKKWKKKMDWTFHFFMCHSLDLHLEHLFSSEKWCSANYFMWFLCNAIKEKRTNGKKWTANGCKKKPTKKKLFLTLHAFWILFRQLDFEK